MLSPIFQGSRVSVGTCPELLSHLEMGRRCARQESGPPVLGALYEGELAWGPGLSAAIFRDD